MAKQLTRTVGQQRSGLRRYKPASLTLCQGLQAPTPHPCNVFDCVNTLDSLGNAVTMPPLCFMLQQSILVQVREALLLRGPFALVILTLGHELIHVGQVRIHQVTNSSSSFSPVFVYSQCRISEAARRQMLGAVMKREAEREFEAFSWMLIEAKPFPPLVHEDRMWILQVRTSAQTLQ